MKRYNSRWGKLLDYVDGLLYVVGCFAVTLLFVGIMGIIGKLAWYMFKVFI